MRICVIDNADGGIYRPDILSDSTTVEHVFHKCVLKHTKYDGNPSLWVFRVNRQPAELSTVLRDGDVVSITPTRVAPIRKQK